MLSYQLLVSLASRIPGENGFLQGQDHWAFYVSVTEHSGLSFFISTMVLSTFFSMFLFVLCRFKESEAAVARGGEMCVISFWHGRCFPAAVLMPAGYVWGPPSGRGIRHFLLQFQSFVSLHGALQVKLSSFLNSLCSLLVPPALSSVLASSPLPVCAMFFVLQSKCQPRLSWAALCSSSCHGGVAGEGSRKKFSTALILSLQRVFIFSVLWADLFLTGWTWHF